MGVAMHVVAGQLDEHQIKELQGIFTALDTNGDGSLSQHEMEKGVAQLGISDMSVEHIFAALDTDGSGTIDYTEFLAAALDMKSMLTEDACRVAFATFDLNGDGSISLAEMHAVLIDDTIQHAVGKEKIEEILHEVDLDRDGTISLDEFMVMMGFA